MNSYTLRECDANMPVRFASTHLLARSLALKHAVLHPLQRLQQRESGPNMHNAWQGSRAMARVDRARVDGARGLGHVRLVLHLLQPLRAWTRAPKQTSQRRTQYPKPKQDTSKAA